MSRIWILMKLITMMSRDGYLFEKQAFLCLMGKASGIRHMPSHSSSLQKWWNIPSENGKTVIYTVYLNQSFKRIKTSVFSLKNNPRNDIWKCPPPRRGGKCGQKSQYFPPPGGHNTLNACKMPSILNRHTMPECRQRQQPASGIVKISRHCRHQAFQCLLQAPIPKNNAFF